MEASLFTFVDGAVTVAQLARQSVANAKKKEFSFITHASSIQERRNSSMFGNILEKGELAIEQWHLSFRLLVLPEVAFNNFLLLVRYKSSTYSRLLCGKHFGFDAGLNLARSLKCLKSKSSKLIFGFFRNLFVLIT
ncbi:MAG: hypothetical protein LBS40_00050 [Burkholderiales bacterium]|jgi:hypothetical protein|nr:hypothetical protein [Burkholderiales bacterium]